MKKLKNKKIPKKGGALKKKIPPKRGVAPRPSITAQNRKTPRDLSVHESRSRDARSGLGGGIKKAELNNKKGGKNSNARDYKHVKTQSNLQEFRQYTLRPQERVDFFVESLLPLISARGSMESRVKKVTLLCEKEKALLGKLYPNKNTRHKYFTKYRKGVMEAVERLMGTELQQSSLDVSRVVLTIMKLDLLESEQRGLESRIKLDKKTNHVALFDMGLFIQTCSQCINDSDPYTVAIGVMGLTGRRTIEILKTGHFEQIDRNSLLFSGQAKTKNSPNAQDNYLIPCLVHPKKILKAVSFLRSKLLLSHLDNEVIDKIHGRNMLNRVKRIMSGVRETEHIHLNCRSLRSMYVMTAYEVFKMSTQVSFNAYAARILGHSKLDKDTANSYSYYAIQRDL